MKKQIILSIFVLALTLVSCFKDKGNYDYRDIKETSEILIPAVDNNKNRMVCNLFDRIQLNPEITYLLGASDVDFDFEWSMVPKSPIRDPQTGYAPKIVVSTQKALDFVVRQDPAEYDMVLKVTNKQSKAATFKKFNFSISVDRGMMIFDENAAGEGDLHIIRSLQTTPDILASQEGILHNYFSSVNNKKIIGGKFLGKRTTSAQYDHVYVFTATGVYRLKSNSGAIDREDYASLFMSAPSALAPQAHSYPNGNSGRNEIIVNNQRIHVIKWNTMGQADFFPSPTTGGFGSALYAAPYIASIEYKSGINNIAVMYDPVVSGSTRGRFVQITSGGSFACASTPTGTFNTANVNSGGATNFQLKYMNKGKDDVTCALFKDEMAGVNNLWLYRVDFRTTTPVILQKGDISTYPDILSANYFTFGTRGDYMYYATDTKIYTTTFDGASSELFQIGANEKIVCMKLYNQLNNPAYDGRLLFVATYNETTKQGKIYRAEIEEMVGKLEPGKTIVQYTGFGLIKDMFNKN